MAASSIRPSLSSFSSRNLSHRLSLFHLRNGIRQLPRNFGLKASRLLRHDSRCMRVMSSRSMSPSATQENALDWVKQDKRRMLHAVYRVGDLDKSIKFYTECLGMKVLRKRDMTEERYTNAFLGYGPEDAHFAIELTYNYGIETYDIGTGFGHFGVALDDIPRVVDIVKAKGGILTREPGPIKGGNSTIAVIEDPDGYKLELLERAPSPEPLCKVMLRVGDLDQSVKFYEKAVGMELLRSQDDPESKRTIAIMGYGPEEKNTVLELTYNYGVREYDKGDAYVQISIGTDDVYKTAEAIKLAGGKITREAGPVPGYSTKITSCVDPDGWKTVFVDNHDFHKQGLGQGTRMLRDSGVCLDSIKAMDGRENSKVHHQQKLLHFEEKEKYTSSCFSYPSFNNQGHIFSTMECNELNNAKVEAERESSFFLTPREESSIESSSSSNAMDEDEEEVSLNELLHEEKTKKKIELLAAMVGVDTNEPAIVLSEVVRVLKVLKAISHY